MPAPGWAACAVLNRNKRAVALDLKDETQKTVLLDLIETADVLENYRPGVLARQGLGYDVLAERNPGLVYVSITGYGPDGPYENRRVYDPLIQATIGMAATQGDLGTRPENVRTIMFDKVTGLTAAQAITAALFERSRTGKGRHLPISMLDSALYYTWPDVMWSRTLQGEGTSDAGELADYFHILATKDGYVSVILIEDDSLQLLAVWRGSEVHLDPRFSTLADRIANRGRLHRRHGGDPRRRLDRGGLPDARRVRYPGRRREFTDRVHEDAQVVQQGSLVETVHPGIGAMRLPRPPARFEEPVSARRSRRAMQPSSARTPARSSRNSARTKP